MAKVSISTGWIARNFARSAVDMTVLASTISSSAGWADMIDSGADTPA